MHTETHSIYDDFTALTSTDTDRFTKRPSKRKNFEYTIWTCKATWVPGKSETVDHC